MGKLNSITNNLKVFKDIDLNHPIAKFTDKEVELIQYIKNLNNIIGLSYTDIGKHFGVSKQAINIRVERILEKTKKQRLIKNKYETLKDNIKAIENNITDLQTEHTTMCNYIEKLITQILAKQTELFYARQQYIDFMKKEGGLDNDNKIC